MAITGSYLTTKESEIDPIERGVDLLSAFDAV